MCRDELATLIKGSIDLHIHPSPSHVPRLLDDFELMEAASAYGMAGILLKNHYESTAGRAALLNRRCEQLGTRAYGGVALNWPVGGLNPYAAESALRMGAAFVWMPTRDAANCLTWGDMPGDFFTRPGITVLDSTGALLPVVYEIFEVVKRYNAVLATGHISAEESIILCRAGRANGVKMVLTHPEWERTRMDVQQQVMLANLGVVIEQSWYNIAEGNCTAAHLAKNIRAIGANNIYLSSDRGQAGREAPVDAFMLFAEALLNEGISITELEIMMKTVPAALVAGK